MELNVSSLIDIALDNSIQIKDHLPLFCKLVALAGFFRDTPLEPMFDQGATIPVIMPPTMVEAAATKAVITVLSIAAVKIGMEVDWRFYNYSRSQ